MKVPELSGKLVRRFLAASVCLTTVALVTLAGCEGPTGPRGPTGAAGPGTRWATVLPIPSGGVVTASLPTGIGVNPPVLACYTSNSPSGPWLVVADGDYLSASSWCALSYSGGAWVAGFHNGITGWYAAFVVVY